MSEETLSKKELKEKEKAEKAQAKLDEKNAKKQAKEDAKLEKKEAKKQAKLDKKEARKQAKIEKKQAKKQAKKEAWNNKTLGQKILHVIKKIVIFLIIICIIALIIYMTIIRKCTFRFIKVEDYDGRIKITREFTDHVDTFKGMLLLNKDKIEVTKDSFLEMLVDADKHIGADAGTVFTVNATGTKWFGGVTVEIIEGEALFTIDNKLNSNSTFNVVTPNATLSVRGTTFDVSYSDRTTTVSVVEGTVALDARGQEYLIEAGETYVITSREVRNLSDLSQAKVGDIILYGTYEQDGDKKNGPEPIEWMVMDEQDGKLLLLSVKGLETMIFAEDGESALWKDSLVREWLNDDFYDEAFTKDEKKAILLSNVGSSVSSWDYGYDFEDDDVSEDYLFVLSFEEFYDYMKPDYEFNFGFYFGYTQAAICAPTDKLIEDGIDTYYFEENSREEYGYSDDCIGKTGAKWWLRSASSQLLGGTNMWVVNGDGGWNDNSQSDDEDIMVRPAMWVDTEK